MMTSVCLGDNGGAPPWGGGWRGSNVVSIWSGLWDECSGIWGVWFSVCVCLSVHVSTTGTMVYLQFWSGFPPPSKFLLWKWYFPKVQELWGGAAVLNISEWLIHLAVISWWKYRLRLPMFPTWGRSSLELVLMLWPEGLMCSDRLQVWHTKNDVSVQWNTHTLYLHIRWQKQVDILYQCVCVCL